MIDLSHESVHLRRQEDRPFDVLRYETDGLLLFLLLLLLSLWMALLEPLSAPLARYHPVNTVACTVQATARRERDPSARSRVAPALAAPAPYDSGVAKFATSGNTCLQFPRCTTYFSPALTTNRALGSLVPGPLGVATANKASAKVPLSAPVQVARGSKTFDLFRQRFQVRVERLFVMKMNARTKARQ